jgi:Flp pilus assembly protein TadD
MGRPELALKELEQAHRQNPDNLRIVNILAQGYEELGQFETARNLYKEALAKHGPHPALANNLCFTYYQEGRWQEAETCYRQTLALDPNNEVARNNLGLLYCRLGRQDEARRLWQEAEGQVAAEHKTRQALAALGMSDRPVYAQAPEPAPALPETATPSPTRAAVVPAAPASLSGRVQPVAQPLAPPKSARQVPPNAGGPEKSATSRVRLAAKGLAQPVPPKASEGPVTEAQPQETLKPLSAAELENTAIEVRNGNGIPHLARQTRTRLNQEGFSVARIGNHIDFGAAKTMIYYRPEAERVAQALSHSFFPKAELQPSQKLESRIAVKILLGTDLVARRQVMARLAAAGR